MNQDQIKRFEETINDQYNNITGMIVQKDGAIVYENYFHGYAVDNALHMYSVTKSIFSALIGIAIEKGTIKSVDEYVLAFFPDYKVLPGEQTIQNITIKHLLTMIAPYKYETEPYLQFFTSPNPILTALDLLGGDRAIGTFNYSAIGGTHILSGILTRATGQSVLDFAQENLFVPLGIQVSQSIAIRSEVEHVAVMSDPNTRGWVIDPQGNHMASWGLFLTPREMAKIGQLYLNHGVWQDKQIVSTSWVTESTSEQSRCVDLGNLAYGYLWWVIDEESFAALGDGGNVIYVNTEKQLVISIASLLIPNVEDRIEWIKKEVEPLFS